MLSGAAFSTYYNTAGSVASNLFLRRYYPGSSPFYKRIWREALLSLLLAANSTQSHWRQAHPPGSSRGYNGEVAVIAWMGVSSNLSLLLTRTAHCSAIKALSFQMHLFHLVHYGRPPSAFLGAFPVSSIELDPPLLFYRVRGTSDANLLSLIALITLSKALEWILLI